MPSLPPPLWAELFYNGAWNDITGDLRATAPVTVTRGLSAESSSTAEPTSCTCDLDSRDDRYAPRNPTSPLYGLIGRNTPFRFGYTVGSPWAEMSGAAGNKLSTPDSAAMAVTDLDLRVEIALEDWSQQKIAGRYSTVGENRSWALSLAGTGQLSFLWSPDGTLASRIARFSTESLQAYNGQRLALRVTLDVNNGAGGYELRFYTGRTVGDAEWSLLGDPITGTSTTAVFDGSAGIELGEVSGLVDNALKGKLFAFKLMTGIGGSTAVGMTTADAAPGATSFTSGGVVWTAAGGALLTNRHIRMTGEVPAWPPTRDLSGRDNYVSITPAGVMRRMDAGNKPQDSALLRYIKTQRPLECWPLADGIETSGGRPLYGSPEMRLDLDSGTATPKWGEGALADWIEPVVLLPSGSDGKLRGATRRAAAAASGWSVDFFYNGKQDLDFTIADYGDMTDDDHRVGWTISLAASTNQITVTSASVGDTTSSVAVQATITSAGVFDRRLHHIRLTTTTAGPTFEVFVDGVSRASGTATGYTSKAVRFVRPGWFYTSITQDLPSIGYITYWGSSAPSAAAVYQAATGLQGERAGARIERLAAESGYAASAAGASIYQQRMGIQGRKKLLDLLGEAAATDFGYLLEARDRNEVIYRGNSTLWNQPPALTLDFSAGLISPPFKPVDDDKLTENDVSVRREFGSFFGRQVLEDGELSVRDFPDGVGRYDTEYTYSLYTDRQADQVASMRLHLGTYAGVRYSRLTLNLANARVFALIDDILRVDVGDKLRLTHLPADHGPDDVDILVTGYSEDAGPDGWTITFNCVPAEPWTAGVVGSTVYGRADTGGCILAEALDPAETSVDVFTTGLARWVDSPTYPSDFPFDVRTGGEVMRVTACTSSVTDTFTRTVTDAWGSATTGGSWTNSGGAGTDYDVTGSAGTHTLTSVNVSRYSVITAPSADVDVVVDVATSVLAAGGPHYVGPVARFTDGNNSYYARASFQTDQTISLVLQKRVGGTQTDITSVAVPYTHAAGTFYRLRFQVIGSALRAKLWTAGGPEPVEWQATATDTALTAAGSVGVRSILSSANTNTLPVTVSYDNFAVLNPQTFTVTRSINGVTKSHPAGQSLSLANPVYVAM
ncbi:hypothetical protein [Streptomyces sp. NPDC020996]|uniref:hypothetical protein n=1 Tax=Streptomyces sp. NPDC020996 TaxID=3154791 RepID=UPI00340D36F7